MEVLEPHPLPRTRQWVEDYRRYGTEPKPAEAPPAPRSDDAPPDLQELVERAGRRYAASIGEIYIEDPFKRPPHHGGCPHITPEEWAEYDRAVAAWQARRRQY